MCYKTAKFKHHKLTWDPSTFNALSSAVFTLEVLPDIIFWLKIRFPRLCFSAELVRGLQQQRSTWLQLPAKRLLGPLVPTIHILKFWNCMLYLNYYFPWNTYLFTRPVRQKKVLHSENVAKQNCHMCYVMEWQNYLLDSFLKMLKLGSDRLAKK